MYSTHAFPEWGGIEPHPTDDDPEYVQQATRTLKDVFGENQDIHYVGADAPRWVKPKLVRAARVLVDQTEGQTLREVCELLRFADAEDIGEDDPNPRVTPKVLAVAAYSRDAWRMDWGVDQLGDEWDESTFITIHDGLDNLVEIAKEAA
jgi:hypothetical protein